MIQFRISPAFAEAPARRTRLWQAGLRAGRECGVQNVSMTNREFRIPELIPHSAISNPHFLWLHSLFDQFQDVHHPNPLI